MTLKYRDFRVEIVPARGDGYTAHVTSPQGEGQARFVPPFRPEDAVLGARGGAVRNFDDGEGEAAGSRSAEEVGEQLSTALFQGEVRLLYERSLDLLADDAGAGLRFELMLDPRDPDVAPLQSLPWELLRAPGTPELLALSRRRPLVRYLAVPRAVIAAPRPRPFRILVVAPSPEVLPRLDQERELRNLRRAVGTADGIEIVEKLVQTLDGLRAALLAQECHALHFMGHGGQLPGQLERVLYFTAPDGRAQAVTGTDLVNKLADFPSVRLAVLNACETAAVSAVDPFSGVAGSLVLAGMPAVIAMREPVTDEAAVLFSRAFYQQIAAGDPVDAATAEGRQAIHSAGLPGAQWAIPALFMRTRSGALYPEQDIPGEGPRLRRLRAGLIAALVLLVLVAGLGFTAWRAAEHRSKVKSLVAEGISAAEKELWEEAAARFRDALAIEPDSPEVLSNLAEAEEHLGHIETAKELYGRAVAGAPGSADLLYKQGHFLNRQQRYDEAFEVLEKALHSDPARPDTYSELAHAAIDRGTLTKARGVLRDGLARFPDDPTLHRLLGDLNLREGDARGALPELDFAWNHYPQKGHWLEDTAVLLIQAHDRLDDGPAVCAAVEKYLRFAPREAMPTNIEQIAKRRGCLPDS